MDLMFTVLIALVLNETHGTQGLRTVEAVEFEGTLAMCTTETILVVTLLKVVH